MQLALEILTGVCATLPDPILEIPGDDEDAVGDDEGEKADQRLLLYVLT